MGRKSVRKVFLLLTKFTPHLIGLMYIIYTLGEFCEFNMLPLGYLFTLTVLPWINLYSASWALDFCYVHRLPLYYVTLDELLLITDYYLHIPLQVENLLLVHLTLIGILILGYTIYYLKNKNRVINN